MTVLSVNRMRQLEQAAVQGGLTYFRLMENAGSAAARAIRAAYPPSGRRVVILCGSGNNGGDGFVIARKLLDEGALVTVVLTGTEPTTPQAQDMLSRLAGTDIPVRRLETEPLLVSEAVTAAWLIVDAVFGIGFHGRLPDVLRPLFRQIQAAGTPVVAVDIPSGLAADSGEADSDTLPAALTVTFSALKPALADRNAQPLTADSRCGEVRVVSIGIDESLIEQVFHAPTAISFEQVKAAFSPRRPDMHKGDCGTLAALVGSDGMAGAAALCSEAALRCGVGLLTVLTPREVYPIVSARVPEAVFVPLDGTDRSVGQQVQTVMRRASAVVIGCGVGVSASPLIETALTTGDQPCVLDAEGINWVARHIDVLRTVRRPLVLTPHPGEMARLCGCTPAEVQKHRAALAHGFVERYGVTLVLKGHETLVAAPNRPLMVNPTGNPGMATGGSGDVLAGMIGSLLAQGLPPFEAAMCGVYLHGAAGDRAAARHSQHAMLPRDICDCLGELFSEIEN